MCSGKSTVGKLVADAIDYPFLDSDELVEEYADSSIAEIFKDEGEEAFRELESTVLQVRKVLPKYAVQRKLASLSKHTFNIIPDSHVDA